MDEPTWLEQDDLPRVDVPLSRVVEQVGSGLVEILAVPDVGVADTVLYDADDGVRVGSGDVLLALGVDADSNAAVKLVETVAAQRGAAMAVKLRGADGRRVIEAATEARVGLLGVTDELTWDQLHRLVRTTLASMGSAPEAEGDPVPLGDLFSLANAVAAMVGGPTTIEDLQSRVLAYSNLDQPIDPPRRSTILGRRVPDRWVRQYQSEGVFTRLWSKGDVVRLPAERLENDGWISERLAIAVRAGTEVLGSIWVAQGDSPLGPAAEDALRQAANIAALHLVKHRATDGMERRMRGELLRTLLESRAPLDANAARLGLEPSVPYVVAAFDVRPTAEAENAVQRDRALQLISAYCESYRRQAALTTAGSPIYALLPLQDLDDLDGVTRLVDRLLTSSEEVLGAALVVAVGTPVGHLREVARSKADADEALRVLLTGRVDRSAATFEQVRTHAIILKLRDLAERDPTLREGKLERLLDQDHRHGSAYVATLRAYLESFGHIPSAAEAISVHPNTFRYRLRRLAEIASIQLDDPHERFVLHLQVQLL